MLAEIWGRLKNLRKPSTYIEDGYHYGYADGYNAGRDIGIRTAYNETLTKEINGIVRRYGQLQVRLLTHTKSEVQESYMKFIDEELDRFKMELQDR